MTETLTPEKVLENGMRIRELIIETGTPEQKLAGLNSAERRELLRLLQEEMDAGAGSGADDSENS